MYLQDPKPKVPKAELATKSFLASHTFNKEMKKKKRSAHNEVQEQAKTDAKPIPDEINPSKQITLPNNITTDKNKSKF